ncbi:hypothetical protein F4821DRAFT_22691 [Hypoxylon rubiginosum]|uniref:Uncharacterized protein n=1 Tax=Hypoxylon rubiginosum TaxID=110542 RepID=A0ACC0DDT4_9PEZI|nr:hypothetical protein F4821DRAFT_22691 [Hypoxylon rubiginosum]
MPPKKAAATAGENAPDVPNAADFRILDTILKACTFDDKPKSIDFDSIAKQLGFKNSAVARERWRQVCKKNNWYSATETDAAASPAVVAKRLAELDLKDSPCQKKIKLEDYQAEDLAWDNIPNGGHKRTVSEPIRR